MSELTKVPELFLKMTMPNLDTDGYYPPELTEWQVSWSAINNLVFLIRSAEVAGAQAASWRDKRVGAAAYCMDRDNSRNGIVGGYNVRTHNGVEMNIHAEEMGIARAEYKGFTDIAALTVWGEPEFDEILGETPTTLLPCRLCLDFMKKSPLITNRTAILSGNSDFSTCQLYGLEDLEKYYDPNRPDEPKMQRMNLRRDVLENRDYDDALMFLMLETWTRLNPDAPRSNQIREWFEAGQPTT